MGWYHSHPGYGYGCWLSGIDANSEPPPQDYTLRPKRATVSPNRPPIRPLSVSLSLSQTDLNFGFGSPGQ